MSWGPRSSPAWASGSASDRPSPSPPCGVAPHEAGTASGLLNSSRQIGASLGLAALGAAAHDRTGSTITPENLSDGYALGLTLGAALLAGAVLMALAVLPRSVAPVPARVAETDDRLTKTGGR